MLLIYLAIVAYTVGATWTMYVICGRDRDRYFDIRNIAMAIVWPLSLLLAAIVAGFASREDKDVTPDN